jgi:hypothetical protein
VVRFGGIVIGLAFIALGLFFVDDLAAIFVGCKAVYLAVRGRDIADALE